MFDVKQHAADIKKLPSMIGKPEYLKYLNGERLTMSEAIKAQCYQCMGYYQGGKEACTSILCPLTLFMPYNPNKQPPSESRVKQGKKLAQARKEKERQTRK
jgi:hypothetical protein